MRWLTELRFPVQLVSVPCLRIMRQVFKHCATASYHLSSCYFNINTTVPQWMKWPCSAHLLVCLTVHTYLHVFPLIQVTISSSLSFDYFSFLSIHLLICPSFLKGICLICLVLCLFICPSVKFYVCSSAHLFISPSITHIHLYVFLPVFLYHLSVRLSIYSTACLSSSFHLIILNQK